MNDALLIRHLAGKVYDVKNSKNKIFSYKNFPEVQCVEYIDETEKLLNGLQAALYISNKNKKAYLIIRGADIGIGKKVFKLAGAKERFIPDGDDDNMIKTTFQDWIYTGLFCTLGFAKLYQFESLLSFYNNIKLKYPDYNIIVGGHSIGGMLAQKLYISVSGISKCITLSAISPWRTFSYSEKKKIRENDFYENDENMINYYTYHDPFRFYPLISKFLGKEKNIKLEPFQSRSNIFASVLERIFWAHNAKYILETKELDFITQKDSKFNYLSKYMSEKLKYNNIFNLIILLINIISIVVFAFFSNFVLETLLKNYSGIFENILYIIKNKKLMLSFISILTSLFYFIPTFILKSRWKFIIFFINLLFGWNFIIWFILLFISIELNFFIKKES